MSRFSAEGKRVGEGVRFLDPSLLKAPLPADGPSPIRIVDGKEAEEIDAEAAEKICASLGVPVPSFPFHP